MNWNVYERMKCIYIHFATNKKQALQFLCCSTVVVNEIISKNDNSPTLSEYRPDNNILFFVAVYSSYSQFFSLIQIFLLLCEIINIFVNSRNS